MSRVFRLRDRKDERRETRNRRGGGRHLENGVGSRGTDRLCEEVTQLREGAGRVRAGGSTGPRGCGLRGGVGWGGPIPGHLQGLIFRDSPASRPSVIIDGASFPSGVLAGKAARTCHPQGPHVAVELVGKEACGQSKAMLDLEDRTRKRM